MAYSEYLADRVRNSLKENNTGFEEKRMNICKKKIAARSTIQGNR
jgi:hypothetical protein